MILRQICNFVIQCAVTKHIFEAPCTVAIQILPERTSFFLEYSTGFSTQIQRGLAHH